MPSSSHEVIVQLFRDRPTLAVEFVAARLALPLSELRNVELLSGDLGQLSAPQHRADTLLLLQGDTGRRLAIVLEVQLAVDSAKRFAWPVYLAGIRAKLRCPTVLLVVALDERVRKWACRPISLGPGGDTIRPLVLGPEAIPAITDARAARKNLELSVLSALFHARSRQAIPVAVATMAAVGTLGRQKRIDEERVKLYNDLIQAVLGKEKVKNMLEALKLEGYEYQSDFAKKYVAQGEAKGRAEGRAEGKTEGEAKGKAEALLGFLAARKLKPSKKQRAAILACRDLARLDRWIARAVSAASPGELFE